MVEPEITEAKAEEVSQDREFYFWITQWENTNIYVGMPYATKENALSSVPNDEKRKLIKVIIKADIFEKKEGN